ncbi:MAG TPA: hypothetical protein PLD20_01855 [Blastocatellia bacterium]|nr:hypothetical protein [Blastocatellia bacterium]HMY75532.1 hypothetical protein [Blastocatellia bacterium]HMZ16681.1 hypothetical protein [Blastocatellia bacterium]HNG33868.1 hypothetical protein [Blastocatellia bacterium]
MKTDKLINAQQVAEMLGLDKKTILAGRCGTDVFTRVRVGRRRVAYSCNEVQAWIEQLIKQAREARQATTEERHKPVKRRFAPSPDEVNRIIAPYRRG